jgi:hypothetical protein
MDDLPQTTFVQALPAWDSFRPRPPGPRYLSQPKLPGTAFVLSLPSLGTFPQPNLPGAVSVPGPPSWASLGQEDGTKDVPGKLGWERCLGPGGLGRKLQAGRAQTKLSRAGRPRTKASWLLSPILAPIADPLLTLPDAVGTPFSTLKHSSSVLRRSMLEACDASAHAVALRLTYQTQILFRSLLS